VCVRILEETAVFCPGGSSLPAVRSCVGRIADRQIAMDLSDIAWRCRSSFPYSPPTSGFCRIGTGPYPWRGELLGYGDIREPAVPGRDTGGACYVTRPYVPSRLPGGVTRSSH
jgi:hypothetical protein